MKKSEVKKLVKTVVGFPKPGIHFKDISVILSQPRAYRAVVDDIWDHITQMGNGNEAIDMVCGLDARGFILGPMIADKLGVGFAMVRKAGKLPPPVIERNYALEYGEDRIAVSSEIIKPGMKVHIHDDLLATGGTMNAAIKLIESCGATVVSVSFVIELTELHDVRMNNGFAILENGDKGIRSYSYLVL